MTSSQLNEFLPLLPVRDVVLFVNLEQSIIVSRSSSVAAAEAGLNSEDKNLVVVAQRDGTVDTPDQNALYKVGTRAIIRKMERLSGGPVSLVLNGTERVTIHDIESSGPYLRAQVSSLPVPDDEGDEVEALQRQILVQANRIEQSSVRNWPKDLVRYLMQSFKDPLDHAGILTSLLQLDVPRQQAVLESPTRLDALRLVNSYLEHELNVISLQQKIAEEAATSISGEQRRYVLRQQMEAIQKELGEQDAEHDEARILRERLDAAELPEEVVTTANRELSRLERLPPIAHDYQLIRGWLEFMLELPWHNATSDNLDLARARQILDEDHYDLQEVKDRIIEHLAVYKLNPNNRGAILCFVGGPGVGKTSLGNSIARALGRKFERISLGGLHDEAELRGHRKTYVGAMPGKIIQSLHRKGVNNPLLMFDEVDKLGHDYRGDPAAALMEILDPAQNTDFRDNYLEVPFDLSGIFFIATANTLDTIPRPLLDRMEVLRLSGYTEEEKVHIARRHLLPQQLTLLNLEPAQIVVPDEVLEHIVRYYTREAGVRELERKLARLVRKSAIAIAEKQTESVRVKVEDLQQLLGSERFFIEKMRKQLTPGVVTGLAWTESGGDVLYVESVLIPGGQGLTLTGQLGAVMKESAQAAQSYIWSQADNLDIRIEKFRDAGIHIHVPAGATPKDGPSAGVTIATSLVSLLSGKKVRSDTAMTGEITLAGLVLPVGGIKEKVLAARRAGINRIILPQANFKDVAEIEESIRKQIEFVPVTQLTEVFAAACEQV